MSIDKYQQSMENWKKEIIIDPHLNALFDSELSAEDFLNQKIKCLGHEDMIKVYMKLTSLKHSISKNMQKQIQTKHSSIEYSFEECLKSKQIYESVNQDELKQNLKQIQKCNEKYEFIAERIIELKNINKVLHFAKALQKLKVNVRLLKSLMKDFDQNNNNHLQIELLNTLKISKIIKQIAQITLKFDFSGIKSFEEARHFINSTRGSIFGLIEKQLNSIFSKLANKQQTKRAELQKDIVNNFIVLNNINKLKDYCIPFFKGILKQTSQLLKKSISIGQLNEQKDLKKNLVGFWQFFSNQVSKKIIQNSYIFVVYDESLRKMSSSPFNFNFLQKYWQNIVSFMKDLINWSIQNDSKEWRKQKTSESLYQAFRIVGEKRILNKFLTSIIWKYPILFKVLSQIGNQVHLHVIKYSQFISYNFSTIKEKLVLTLLPLAQLYYKHANLFFQALGNNLQKICSDISNEAGNNLNQHLNRLLQLLSETRTNKNVIYIEQWVTIMEWLVYSVQTEQISEYLATKSLQICQQSCNVISQAVKSNFNEHKQLLGGLIQKIRIYINKVKTVLTQKLYKQKSNEKTQNKFTLHSFAPNSQQMVIIIRRFSQYKQLLQQSKKLIEQNSI